MEHRLVTAIEKALGWSGPGSVGTAFARGRLPDLDLAARLMTPYRLLEVIRTRHLANPQLRCYADGNEVHPSRYLNTSTNRRRQPVTQADMAGLGHILNGGGTVVLDHVDSFDPTLEVACRALGWWSGELVSSNLYLATGDTDGFPLHWDDHDVIAIQLSGEKSWEVRGPSRIAPMYRDAERNHTPSEDILWVGTMTAGDIMHIPRGFWHTATRLGSGDTGHSLHVTFGITKRTGVTWTNYLSDVVRAHEHFRTDLERDQDPADRQLLITELGKLSHEFDPGRYLDELRANTPPARHTPYVASLGALDTIAAVTEFAPVIRRVADTIEVIAGGKRLSLHSRVEDELRALLCGHPIHLADGSRDLTTLATHLIKEGLCTQLNAESSSGYTGLVQPVTFSKAPSSSA